MPKKIQPAQRSISYSVAANVPTGHYIDIAKDLSMINRRLYEQGKQYFIESIDFGFIAPVASVSTVAIAVATAGDTWVVHNAHTKGKALHKEMQNLVLKDNPSVSGKWSDFKVYLDDHHKAVGTLAPNDGDGNPVRPGEWDYSTFVMPQHDVDPTTGEPLPALEFETHLVGGDSGTASGSTMGLVKAYAQSRAHVQPVDPQVPTTLSTSFFSLLTDSGSQEPELADVIEDENDQPPYDADEYPGGTTNSDAPWVQEFALVSAASPNGVITGFAAECGLMKIGVRAYDPAGGEVALAAVAFRVNVMPGSYKGVAALPMGQ